MAIRLFHRDSPTLRLPLISKDARFIIWPGVGAWDANLNYVVLEPGEANVPHVHVHSEDSISSSRAKARLATTTTTSNCPFTQAASCMSRSGCVTPSRRIAAWA